MANNIAQLKTEVIGMGYNCRFTRTQLRKSQNKQEQRYLQAHLDRTCKPLARATHLAYGFLNRVPYRAMEANPRTQPDWDLVLELVKSYCGDRYAHLNINAEIEVELWAGRRLPWED